MYDVNCIWVIPREIYNSTIFSHEKFFKMFFKQFKSILIFLFRRYMKNVIGMNFFSFRIIKNLLLLNILILCHQMIKTISFYPRKSTIV